MLLVTLVSGIIAGLQLSGRFALSFSDVLTPRVNTLLQAYRVELSGVSGSWHRFNPVVRAAHVRFAAGEMHQVEVEVDFFRSLLSDSLVFARVHVQDGQVGLVYTSSGWQLKGALDKPLDIDFVGLAQNTRFMDAAIRVTLERDTVAAAYDVALKFSGHGQNSQAVASIVSPASTAQTREFSVAAAMNHTAQSREDAPSQALIRFDVQGDLFVRPGLLGSTGLAVSVSDGSWFESKNHGDESSTLGWGKLSAGISVIDSPLVKAGITPKLLATVELQHLDQSLLGQVHATVFAEEQDPLVLPEVSFQVNTDEVVSALGDTGAFSDVFAAKGALAKAVATNIALEPITEFGTNILIPGKVLGEWVAGLNVRGHVSELVAYYDKHQGVGFAAQARQLKLSPHRGSPSFSNIDADVFGDLQNIGISLSGHNVTMEFPTVFTDAWFFEQVRGELTLLFRKGYASVRGYNIEAHSGLSRIAGELATSRPSEREEQRISLGVEIDVIQTESIGSYIPRKINAGLRQWLQQAPQAGDLMNTTIAHHGQIHLSPGSRSRRRFEMTTDFQNASVKFARDWPALVDGIGKIHIAGPAAFGSLDNGKISDFDLAGTNIRVESAQGMAFLDLASKATGSELLNLIRVTPLQQALSFVSPQWSAEGDISYSAEIAIPLGEAPGSESGLKVDLATRVDSLDLNMPEYRLAWKNLSGQQTFSLPHYLQGQVNGELFDESVQVGITHDPEHLKFRFQGQIGADDILYLADIQPNPVLSGGDSLEGELTLAMGVNADSQLRVNTDLRGFAVHLPAQFGKPLGVLEPSEFVLTFGSNQKTLDWRYGVTQGRLVVPGEDSGGGIRGAVGIDAPPLDVEADYEGFVVSGKIYRVDFAEWVPGGRAVAVKTPFNWQIRELDIGELVIDELAFSDVILNGEGAPNVLVLQLQGQDIAGSVDLSDPAFTRVDLLKLRLPAISSHTESFSGNLDPIDIDTGGALPRAKVLVDRLYLGEEAFGRWKFDIVPEPGSVRFDLEAVAVNGLRIADSVLRWDLQQNVSAFSGAVDFDDLAKTLPLWGYAPVVTTTTAAVKGNLSWVGSPANIDVAKSEGSLSLTAAEGRFFDIETPSPGLRAVSLLNITALTKRISLDFSDVVGEGISFEEASGTIQLEDQRLTFTENLMIQSTSSRYELGGEVDLRTNQLDAQMIVTLPVSDSLPWYAAYLAFINPVAAIGLAVGERIFRKPIERMSSAKFAVSGELDDPAVVFTDLFNQDIAVADAAGERLSPDLLKKQGTQSQGGEDKPARQASPLETP